MSGVDVAAFLRARVAEAEDAVWRWDSDGRCQVACMSVGGVPGYTTVASGSDGRWVADGKPVVDARDVEVMWDPARVLAGCAAKRAIVAKYERACYQADHDDADFRDVWDEIASTLEQVVMLHARVYADHPDFRGEWAVSP